MRLAQMPETIYMYAQMWLCIKGVSCHLLVRGQWINAIACLSSSLGMVAKIIDVYHRFLAQFMNKLSADEAEDSDFFTALRVCVFSCHARFILVVPFDSLAS